MQPRDVGRTERSGSLERKGEGEGNATSDDLGSKWLNSEWVPLLPVALGFRQYLPIELVIAWHG